MSNDDLIGRILRGQGPILGRITGTGTGMRKQNISEERAMRQVERAKRAVEHITDSIRSLVNTTYDNEFMSGLPEDLAQRFRAEVNQLTDIPALDELIKTLDDITSILEMR